MKGGVVMTDYNREGAIKFSLEESVWFRQGEEIAELYNLSLEPNITIHDLEHFVSIRGSLKMYGEYKKKEANPRDENESFVFSGQKYVTVLDTREEGVSEFHFEFPVDVTIPKSKVRSLEDLDVVIDNFDYTMQDADCLKLSTNILITGLEPEDVSVYEQRDLQTPDEEKNRVENLVDDHKRLLPLKDTRKNHR